jgi:hypothetical protein
MKNQLIYSLVIYVIFYILIITNKPELLYDNYGNIKSLDYLNYKINIGFENLDEYINLPIISILLAISSYYLSSLFDIKK